MSFLESMIVIIPLIIIGFVLEVVFDSAKKETKNWAAVAEQLGLVALGKSFLRGHIDGFLVVVDTYKASSGKSEVTRTRVVIDGGMTPAVSFAREGFISGFFGQDVHIGDPSFDSFVKVGGDEVTAVSLLDADMRFLVKNAVAIGWRFTEGHWTYETSARLSQQLVVVIERGLDISRAFRDAHADLVGRLGGVARFDPIPAVRKRALELLVTHHPEHPATIDVANEVLHDSNLELVSIAAGHLGDLDVLERIANDRDASQALRIDAMRAMLRVAPDDVRGAAIVAKWLTFVTPATRSLRLAAIAALPSVEVLDAETRLIEALGSDDDDVALQAIKTLGAIGTVAAVPALIPIRDKLLGFAQKGAAKDAILAIQARIAGADAGALALSNEGGSLAFVDESS